MVHVDSREYGGVAVLDIYSGTKETEDDEKTCNEAYTSDENMFDRERLGACWAMLP